MNCIDVAKKLNLTLHKLDFSKSACFIEDVDRQAVSSLIEKERPFAKVAIFCTEKSFLDLGDYLSQSMKEKNLKPIVFVIKESCRIDVTTLCGLFAMPEDIRFTVITDTSLIGEGVYFSTVRKIPLLAVINDYNFSGLFSPFIYINNGEGLDKFGTECFRYVFFDKKRLDESCLVDGFSFLSCATPDLFDYKLNSIISGEEQNTTVVELIQNEIENICKSVETDVDLSEKVLLSAFVLEVCRSVDYGKLISCSSTYQSARLFNERDKITSLAQCFCAKAIMQKYYEFFCLDNSVLEIPDYKEIATQISQRTTEDLVKVSENILAKVNLLKQTGGKERFKVAVKGTFQRLKNCFDAIHKLYRAHGGKKSYCQSRIQKAVELSGYSEKRINGITFIKEI